MIASFISEQERVFRVVGVLCMLYRFQDREIHKLARISDPSLSISFGDREWNWIMCGGPAQFFARVEPTFREHYPDMYDPDILQARGVFSDTDDRGPYRVYGSVDRTRAFV
jgi:hypothetical protein